MKKLDAIQKHMDSVLSSSRAGAGLTMVSWPSITLQELAHRLDQFTEAPVIDGTGLTGKYSVTIEISNNTEEFGNTIFNAIENLGLRLEPRKVSIETLIVDQISSTPTPN
jgi:uncharacterized protein (TIGR03435 family)